MFGYSRELDWLLVLGISYEFLSTLDIAVVLNRPVPSSSESPLSIAEADDCTMIAGSNSLACFDFGMRPAVKPRRSSTKPRAGLDGAVARSCEPDGDEGVGSGRLATSDAFKEFAKGVASARDALLGSTTIVAGTVASGTAGVPRTTGTSRTACASQTAGASGSAGASGTAEASGTAGASRTAGASGTAVPSGKNEAVDSLLVPA